jgi:hypothetical protein
MITNDDIYFTPLNWYIKHADIAQWIERKNILFAIVHKKFLKYQYGGWGWEDYDIGVGDLALLTDTMKGYA